MIEVTIFSEFRKLSEGEFLVIEGLHMNDYIFEQLCKKYYIKPNQIYPKFVVYKMFRTEGGLRRFKSIINFLGTCNKGEIRVYDCCNERGSGFFNNKRLFEIIEPTTTNMWKFTEVVKRTGLVFMPEYGTFKEMLNSSKDCEVKEVKQGNKKENNYVKDYLKSITSVKDVEKVVFNPPATIIFWKDGDITSSKCHSQDKYDTIVGYSLALTKKLFKNTTHMVSHVEKWERKNKVKEGK